MISLAKKFGFKLHVTDQFVSGRLQVIDKAVGHVPDREFVLYQRQCTDCVFCS